jgi:D-alanyl-D-alanine carboxypeptidase
VLGGTSRAIAFAAMLLAAGPALAHTLSSFVMDADTGQVVEAVGPDHQNYPASLTKMMTLYLTFEALQHKKITLGTPLKISSRAARMQPSKLGLRAGETITVKEAISALAVKSANDVAVAVAEALSGTEARFARAMTEKAHTLGMTHTNFRNASGLPNRHQLSTARDMAKLAVALRRDFPQYVPVFAQEYFTYDGRRIRNHNHLLGRVDGVNGMKTGYIAAAGFNIVVSAERNGRRLIGVVMGGTTPTARDRLVKALLAKGFDTPPLPPVRTAALSQRAATAAVQAPAATATDDAAPVEATPPVPRTWSVQVGAFRQYASASRSILHATRSMRSLRTRPTSILRGEGDDDESELYRARILGFTEADARQACTQLKHKRLRCLVIPPEEDSNVDPDSAD